MYGLALLSNYPHSLTEIITWGIYKSSRMSSGTSNPSRTPSGKSKMTSRTPSGTSKMISGTSRLALRTLKTTSGTLRMVSHQ